MHGYLMKMFAYETVYLLKKVQRMVNHVFRRAMREAYLYQINPICHFHTDQHLAQHENAATVKIQHTHVSSAYQIGILHLNTRSF